MVVLLHAVDDTLSGRVVDDPLSADRVRDGTTLRRVLSLGFNRDRVSAEHVQFAFGECLLVKLTTLSRGCNWIEDTGIGNPCFGMVGDELIAVGGDANPRIPGSARHDASLRTV